MIFTLTVAPKRAVCFYLQHPLGINMWKAKAFAVSRGYDIPRKRIRGDNAELVRDFWLIRIIDADVIRDKTPPSSFQIV